MLMPSSFESPDSELFGDTPPAARRLILGISAPSRIRDWNKSTFNNHDVVRVKLRLTVGFT